MIESLTPADCILEIKQALDHQVEEGAGRSDPAGTLRMLGQMRGVLSRELDRFAQAASQGEGIDGKAAVDLISLIARTLEKLDQLERQVAEAEAGRPTELTVEQRRALRQTVADLISALAERRNGQAGESAAAKNAG